MFQTSIGKDIGLAITWLEQGELVAIPTETVYGLAANGFNPFAIAKIYHVKNRPQFNPLILHVAGLDKLRPLVSHIPDVCKVLMECFSPGPITYLLPKSDLVPDLVTAGSSRVAVRIPQHPITLDLLSRLDFPLAAPSANPSGYVSPVSATHVMDGLQGKIPYILDGGNCQVGLESTIVGFEGETVLIYRLGSITAEQINQVCNSEVKIALQHRAPSTPGQLKSHYATKTRLLIGEIADLLENNPGLKIGVISFQNNYFSRATENIILSPAGNLEEAAANLFSAMRTLDGFGLDLLVTEMFPDSGIGLAINDRLARAAYRE
ncbi:MAG: hypothetical protein RLZZ557_880 [Bacteroidota bacterium]